MVVSPSSDRSEGSRGAGALGVTVPLLVLLTGFCSEVGSVAVAVAVMVATAAEAVVAAVVVIVVVEGKGMPPRKG